MTQGVIGPLAGGRVSPDKNLLTNGGESVWGPPGWDKRGLSFAESPLFRMSLDEWGVTSSVREIVTRLQLRPFSCMIFY